MRTIQQLPFLKILLPFILGIFTGIYLQVSWQLMVWVILFTLILQWLIIYYLNTKLKALPYYFLGVITKLSIIALGFLVVDTYRDTNSPLHFEGKSAKFYKIKVNDYPIEKFKNHRFIGRVEALVLQNDSIISARGNILCYWNQSLKTQPQAGDIYWINTKLLDIPSPKNPDEFNYKQYLSYNNIYYKCYLKDESQFVSASEKGFSLKSTASKMRTWAQGVFQEYLPDKRVYTLATALILGSKNELDAAITEDFSHTGTLHVLAVSGLHVGIIFLLLMFITKPLKRIKYGSFIQGFVVVIAIWLFALITGFSPSVQRSAVMFSLFAVGQVSGIKGAGINTLLGSAFLMLAYNPFLIVNVGFQLSYCAVLGIMLIHQPIYELFNFSAINNKYVWKLVDKSWSVCSISFAAQLGTFPISLFYFGQFPTYFMFSNLVVIPAIFLMVYAALAILVFSFIPLLASVAAFIFNGLSLGVLWSVSWVAHLPIAFAEGLHFSFLDVLIVYVIIAFFIVFLHLKKLRYLNYTLCSLLLFLTLVNSRYVANENKNTLTVHSIKNNNVLTYISGNKAIIIADSAFINNTSAQKFYLAPYFRGKYIKHTIQKPIRGNLAGFSGSQKEIKLLIFQTKYPDINPFITDKNYHFLLPKNKHNQNLLAQNQPINIIWTYQSPYALPISDTQPKLDSFAIRLNLP